jgi:phosphoribosylformylglycinamidine (FGAM) synthase-like amidotransferase family enzyme
MKQIKLRAKIRISTSKGSFSAGDVFEIEERYAKRLIEAGYAEKLAEPTQTLNTNEANTEINPEKELEKLKVDELKELAEVIGFNAGDLKKAELIKKLIEEIKANEAFTELLEMKADEIKAYLDNE